MKTKYLVRFLNRVANFDADLELVDVLYTAVDNGRLKSDNDKIFDFVRADRHPRLHRRQDRDSSRVVAVRHLRNTLHSSYIKDLYEDSMRYMQDLIQGAAANGLSPDRLVGEHRVSFAANDILSAKSWDAIIAMVSSSLFRAIENQRSTTKLLNAVNTKLGLGVDAALVSAALPYLELRHLYVHQDGVADEDFCTRCPGFGAQVGNRVGLPLQLISDARSAIEALVWEYDRCAVEKDVVSNSDLQP